MKRSLALGTALATLAVTLPAAAASRNAALGAGGDVAVPGSARVQQAWSTDLARVPEAREPGRNGFGVTVAVLDTWIDGGHPDFGGRVLIGADCVGGECRPGMATDTCDHGTHVAGTIASSSFGVAPNARVLPVRVLAFDDDSGSCTGTPDDVAAGVRYAAREGVQVINLSLGSEVPSMAEGPLADAIRQALRQGITVVIAAGNGQVPFADVFDGEALVVAATVRSGQLASYSQRGGGVTIAAPGGEAVGPSACSIETCVTSLYPGGSYAVAAGTSMAAPIVSGVAAQLYSQNLRRKGPLIRRQILATGRPIPGAGGLRLIDAAAAVGVQSPPPPLPTVPPPTPGGQAEGALPAPSQIALEIDRPTTNVSIPGSASQVDSDDDSLPLLPAALGVFLIAIAGGGWLAVRKAANAPAGASSGAGGRSRTADRGRTTSRRR